jgi:hypothetical protein
MGRRDVGYPSMSLHSVCLALLFGTLSISEAYLPTHRLLRFCKQLEHNPGLDFKWAFASSDSHVLSMRPRARRALTSSTVTITQRTSLIQADVILQEPLSAVITARRRNLPCSTDNR